MASSPPDTTGKLDLGTHAVPANELKGSTPLSEDSKGESDTKVPDHKILGVDGHLYPNMSAWRRNLLTATCATMVLNIMQVQTVTISVEIIGKDLDIPIPSYQWLASAYSLAFGSLLLLFGRLADIYGHKRAHLAGMTWFCIWSIAIGFAPNEISIFIFRAMQGAGAGAAIPAALGILGSSFPPSQAKSTAFATFSAGAPIGGSLGSVFGGIMAQYAAPGWRATFYLSAGLAALVAISAYLVVPPDGPIKAADRKVDWIGAFLITVGLVLLIFSLADGSGVPNGWRTPYIPVCFSIAILLLVTFWFWERHVEFKTEHKPLMKTSLWYKSRFAAVQLVGALGWSCFSSQDFRPGLHCLRLLTDLVVLSFVFFATLYYQTYLKLSPILTTVRFLPGPVTGVCLNVVVAIVAGRVGVNYLIILGCVGCGLAPLLFAVQDVNAPYWQYDFPAMILSVFGADFIFSSGIMYVSREAGHGQQALAAGIFNTTCQMGTAIGLAIMTIIQSKVTESEMRKLGLIYNPNSSDVPPSVVLKALRMAFYGAASFAFAAGLVAAVTLYGQGPVGHRVKKVPKVDP